MLGDLHALFHLVFTLILQDRYYLHVRSSRFIKVLSDLLKVTELIGCRARIYSDVPDYMGQIFFPHQRATFYSTTLSSFLLFAFYLFKS